MNETRTVKTETDAFRPLDTTSILRPAKLLCPDCGRRPASGECVLENISLGKGGFYHCKACGGAWFLDLGVDDALLAAGKHAWPEPESKEILESLRKGDAADAPEASIAAPAVGAADGAWNCPCCRGNLVTVHDRRGCGAIVRRCLVCYGGWIEYAGLRRAMEATGGLLSSMGRFMSGLLSG